MPSDNVTLHLRQARWDFCHCEFIFEWTAFKVLRYVKCPVKLPRCCYVSLVMFTSCLGYLAFTHQALSFMVFYVTIGLVDLILTSFSPLFAVNSSNCGCSKLIIFTFRYVSLLMGSPYPYTTAFHWFWYMSLFRLLKHTFSLTVDCRRVWRVQLSLILCPPFRVGKFQE